MTELHTTPDENISALMDGELRGLAQQVAMASVLSEPNARATWHAYHVVGDVLRSEALADATQDLQFWTRLQSRLAQEPLPAPSSVITQNATPPLSGLHRHSANAPVFWRAMAGVACSALVAVIGYSVWAPGSVPAIGLMAGNAPQAVTGGISPAVSLDVALGPDGMIRDPRLDQLLNAHQQLGGHSALQMPSGFLRNATYEGAGQ